MLNSYFMGLLGLNKICHLNSIVNNTTLYYDNDRVWSKASLPYKVFLHLSLIFSPAWFLIHLILLYWKPWHILVLFLFTYLFFAMYLPVALKSKLVWKGKYLKMDILSSLVLYSYRYTLYVDMICWKILQNTVYFSLWSFSSLYKIFSSQLSRADFIHRLPSMCYLRCSEKAKLS